MLKKSTLTNGKTKIYFSFFLSFSIYRPSTFLKSITCDVHHANIIRRDKLGNLWKDQLFEANAFKGVISSGIHGRKDQKFEANSSKDVISLISPWKEKSNI